MVFTVCWTFVNFMKNPILYVHNRMNKTDSIQMAHSYILSDVVICQWQVVQLFALKVNSPYSDLLNIDKIWYLVITKFNNWIIMLKECNFHNYGSLFDSLCACFYVSPSHVNLSAFCGVFWLTYIWGVL